MREHPLRQHLERQLTQAASLANTFTALQADDARLQLEHALTPGHARGVLHGRTVAVKDLFDLAGQVTTAGGQLFGPQGLKHAPAQSDATAVARLKAAGAVMLGRTNMSEFAFSGVGINPHFGTPRNPCDPNTVRVPGGSSSGSAVAVAAHAADIGLGTDTGGSLRIPAALCGIVGFKPTASSVSQQGCFPLSRSLDSVGAMTRSVADAKQVHMVLSQTHHAHAPGLTATQLHGKRIGVAHGFMTADMDATVSQAWTRTLSTLEAAGAELVDWNSSLIEQAASLQAGRSLVTMEAFALHHQHLATHPHLYDPRVLARIQMGKQVPGTYEAVLEARRTWIQAMNTELGAFDAVIAPTVPMVAPPLADIAPGAERDDVFFKTNAILLRNTSVVNFLDGCAISIPCHAAAELPVGLMIWQRGGQDFAILDIAAAVEAVLAAPGTLSPA